MRVLLRESHDVGLNGLEDDVALRISREHVPREPLYQLGCPYLFSLFDKTYRFGKASKQSFGSGLSCSNLPEVQV